MGIYDKSTQRTRFRCDDRFIRFIQLTYSHAHPPQRKIYVNGYLGPSFSLGSGVAQGDPISPLLFLCIAEPLARLIMKDPTFKGVVINKVRHKISENRCWDAPKQRFSPGGCAPQPRLQTGKRAVSMQNTPCGLPAAAESACPETGRACQTYGAVQPIAEVPITGP